jgi:hypothetical protein
MRCLGVKHANINVVLSRKVLHKTGVFLCMMVTSPTTVLDLEPGEVWFVFNNLEESHLSRCGWAAGREEGSVPANRFSPRRKSQNLGLSSGLNNWALWFLVQVNQGALPSFEEGERYLGHPFYVCSLEILNIATPGNARSRPKSLAYILDPCVTKSTSFLVGKLVQLQGKGILWYLFTIYALKYWMCIQFETQIHVAWARMKQKRLVVILICISVVWLLAVTLYLGSILVKLSKNTLHNNINYHFTSRTCALIPKHNIR